MRAPCCPRQPLSCLRTTTASPSLTASSSVRIHFHSVAFICSSLSCLLIKLHHTNTDDYAGMGPDGHVASLFPNRAGTAEKKRWVVGVPNSPKPPADRISMTLPVINAAKNVFIYATGYVYAYVGASTVSSLTTGNESSTNFNEQHGQKTTRTDLRRRRFSNECTRCSLCPAPCLPSLCVPPTERSRGLSTWRPAHRSTLPSGRTPSPSPGRPSPLTRRSKPVPAAACT